jgi:hypothetical protein
MKEGITETQAKKNRVGVRFTLTPEEATAMRMYTSKEGMTMADFARSLTLREIGMSRAAS